MKLAYVDICGFRGYRHAVRLEFADAFTIIDGRNGVGKSTIFDAVEFALTGELSKYNDAKAAGETVADYIWWTGSGEQPADRYVEVGFRDADGIFAIKRTQFGKPTSDILKTLTEKLSETGLSPSAPLKQLCSTSIIRDEHIAELSLDLKEADRYALVRDALGANDAETWISRAASLVAAAKKRAASALQEVTAINGEAATAARRTDEIRAGVVDESALAESIARLQTFASALQLAPDQVVGPARARIAEVNSHLEIAQTILSEWERHSSAQRSLDALIAAARNAEHILAKENETLAALSTSKTEVAASSLADKARSLVALVSMGRQIGLVEDGCPLCTSKLSTNAFEHGLHHIQALAVEIDDQAARQAEAEAARVSATRRRDLAAETTAIAQARVSQRQLALDKFERDLKEIGLVPGVTRNDLIQRIEELRSTLEVVQRDLRIVGTMRFSTELEKARRLEADIQLRLGRAQEKFSRARKAEATAQSLHDATRRAAAESLDRRLDRVLPLMSELYRRLRPHPIWRDIEYSIRGDVRRFLKLQVGDELNPQFLFSSGQRRATGLAFLLSVNISLAWSRWRSILLDDPVQHVDDFRTIHLAEVLAQLVSEGRQIICSVEDAALADLLCRRLPVSHAGEAKRVTLGLGADGSSSKIAERALQPFSRRSLVLDSASAALG